MEFRAGHSRGDRRADRRCGSAPPTSIIAVSIRRDAALDLLAQCPFFFFFFFSSSSPSFSSSILVRSSARDAPDGALDRGASHAANKSDASLDRRPSLAIDHFLDFSLFPFPLFFMFLFPLFPSSLGLFHRRSSSGMFSVVFLVHCTTL